MSKEHFISIDDLKLSLEKLVKQYEVDMDPNGPNNWNQRERAFVKRDFAFDLIATVCNGDITQRKSSHE